MKIEQETAAGRHDQIRRGGTGWTRSRAGRTVIGAAAASAALTFMVGSFAGAANAAGSTSVARSTSAMPAAVTVAASTKGCAAGGAAIPKGAGRAKTADLDGDGKKDTIWLADKTASDGGVTRTLGVRTASGAGFTKTFNSASPINATAVAGPVGSGTPVILLDFGRDAKLYAVKSCKIVVSHNVQGDQYTFDREQLTGYGTGAGCPVIGKTGRQLVGYLAKEHATNDRYTVTRTTVKLSKGGSQARNGTTTTLGTNLKASSSIVKTATAVTCGTSGRAVEPEDS